MTELQRKLVCALIGLVRAVEGNEHLLTPHTDFLLIKGLLFSKPGEVKPDAVRYLLEEVAAEKKRIIPNCFLCAMPCGRTADPKPILFTKDPDAPHRLNFLKALSQHPLSGTSLYRAIYLLGTEQFDHETAAELLAAR